MCVPSAGHTATRQLLDPQVLVGNQGLIIRGLGSGDCELRLGVRSAGGFGDQCRL
jgi:hypothetical protein